MIRSSITSLKKNSNRYWFYGLLLLAGLGGVWLTYNYFIAFSDYAIVILFVILFIGLFDWFDSRVIREVSTMDELKKGNIAYAIFLLAIAVLVLAAAVIVG